MDGAEKKISLQRKTHVTEVLCEGPYMDVCLSEDELSDWSEEDLSLHFSASVLNPSESESEQEPGLDLDLTGPNHRGLELTGPDLQLQVQSPDLYLDLPEDKPRPQRLPQQQEQPRSQLFLRQHSLPESGGRAYKGLIAGLQTQTGGVQVQRRLQKSLSLDETRTKLASCLIKNVLSKRMKEEDQHVAPKPTKLRPRPPEDQLKPKVQAPSRLAPPPGLTSKPPSRGHMIKLAASLSHSQYTTETSQPITAHRCSSQPITDRRHSNHSDMNQSELAPQAPPPAQEQRSSLGDSEPGEDPPWSSSRELQKAPHESPPAQEEASSLGPPAVDLPRVCSRELHYHSTHAQEKGFSVGHSRPKVPQRFSYRRLQTMGSGVSPSAQDQASSLGHNPGVDSPRFSSTELCAEVRHSSISAQEQSTSLGRHQQTVSPPWTSTRVLPQSLAKGQRSSHGHRQLVVAPPWYSSRDVPQSSAPAQTQASSVGYVRPVPPWSSSAELQAPQPPPSAQDKASALGRVRPVLPWFSLSPGAAGGVSDPQEFVEPLCHVTPSHVTSVKGGLQRKTLLDPETGQFVQVFVPVPGYAPMLHSPAPVLAGPTPSVLPLGYGSSLLSVTPNPTMLVPVQHTIVSQPCFMFPPLQPWVYYRPA